MRWGSVMWGASPLHPQQGAFTFVGDSNSSKVTTDLMDADRGEVVAEPSVIGRWGTRQRRQALPSGTGQAMPGNYTSL